MQNRFKPLLVVTDAATFTNITTKYEIVPVSNSRLFPSIHELTPAGLVLDYDYLGDDTIKILRRLKSNPFYNKLKIYCYKSRPHTKVDDLLKVLGVQHFIYATENQQPKTTAVAILTEMLTGVWEKKLQEQIAD